MAYSKIILNLQTVLKSWEIPHWLGSVCDVGIKGLGGRVILLHPSHSPLRISKSWIISFSAFIFLEQSGPFWSILGWHSRPPPPSWSFSMSSSSLPPASLCFIKICPERHAIFLEIRESGFYLYPLMLKNLIMIKWIILGNLYWNLSPKSFIPSFTHSLSYSIRNQGDLTVRPGLWLAFWDTKQSEKLFSFLQECVIEPIMQDQRIRGHQQ